MLTFLRLDGDDLGCWRGLVPQQHAGVVGGNVAENDFIFKLYTFLKIIVSHTSGTVGDLSTGLGGFTFES